MNDLHTAAKQALPFGVGGGLVAIKTLLSRDPCAHANVAIEMIDAILAEQPAQQEPVSIGYWNQKTGAYYKPDQVSAAHKKLIEDGILRLCYTSQPPAQPEQPAQQEPYTYASKQATNCAGCGEHKHTPLRIDKMGGYVCLTCIDKKLGSMLGEFGYPEPEQPTQQEPVAWIYQCSADSSGPVLMQHKRDWAESGSGLWTETPLYTHPQAREPLSEVQIATVYWGATGQSLRPQDNALAHKFARAIEAAHGIGEKK